MKASFGCFRLFPAHAALAVFLVCGPPAAAQRNQIFDQRILAPFVPTPQTLVERMLDLADVSKSDIVYDLGSGDGRILFTAAGDFGARAVGIEINAALVRMTRDRVESHKLRDRIEVRHEDLLEADLSPATVVTVYLLTASNEQLKPKFERELRPGVRVVAHDFQFHGWKPSKTVAVDVGSRDHKLYLYVIGEHR